MAASDLVEKTMIPEPSPAVTTSALEDEGLMAANPTKAAFREAWRQISGRVSMMRFIVFSDLEAEGLQPPVLRAIQGALSLIESIAKLGTFPPPRRVLPNGEGGVVLERWEGPLLERIEISADGHSDVTVLNGPALVLRRQLT